MIRPRPKHPRDTLTQVITATLTEADVAYIRANFLTLEEVCATRTESPEAVQKLIENRLLPRPSYVLDDGSGMFPADYFRLADDAGGAASLRDHFAARYRAAAAAAVISDAALEEDWASYLDGAPAARPVPTAPYVRDRGARRRGEHFRARAHHGRIGKDDRPPLRPPRARLRSGDPRPARREGRT